MGGEIGGLLGNVQGVNGLFDIVEPVGRAKKYALNRGWPNTIPDPQTLINLLVTGHIDWEKAKWDWESNGLSFYWLEKMTDMIRRRPEVADLISLYRRGHVNTQQFMSYMNKLGVDPQSIPLFFKAYEYFPPPPDLIRFAVREVYTPETIQKFGMGEDLPPEFIKEAYKAGLPPDQAANYWKAHWELPSASQGFEMFQRGIIDKEELNLLLKSLDIMPFWRERLTKMAYNVITRVDARRMYRLGVYGPEELKTAYKNMGYSPEDSDNLTEFTMRLEQPEVEGLSRSAIIGAYKRDLLTKEELTELLKKLNYPDTVVAFWVENADWEKTIDDLDIILGEYQDQFLSGIIDESELRRELDYLDLPAAGIDSIIEKLVKKKIRQRKIPTKAELLDWLQAGIIEEETFFQRMRLLGYSDVDTRNYLTFVTISRETVERRFLQDDDYIRWYTKKILTLDELQKIFEDKHYSTKDVERLLQEAKDAYEQLQEQGR
jgi:hypothetical protein